jgi:hypothetical protein
MEEVSGQGPRDHRRRKLVMAIVDLLHFETDGIIFSFVYGFSPSQAEQHHVLKKRIRWKLGGPIAPELPASHPLFPDERRERDPATNSAIDGCPGKDAVKFDLSPQYNP